MSRRVLAGILCAIGVIALAIYQRPVSGPYEHPKKDPSLTLRARKPIDYSRDILPILSSNCFACHGPDRGARKAKLRLDVRDAAVKSEAFVPGKSADSELVRRIFADDATERMPPRKTGKTLTASEKDLLKRWIDEGAKYQVHWAFVKPERPKVPSVKNQAWVRNDIDAFVLARLEAAGLEPSPRADPLTLIRRLSLDLRGLPPTLDEVDAFLKTWRDPTASPQAAWEQAVDRMLASPHFGEKMALLWLDLARFGDTSGYHEDSTRQMWLWRDWVINAFNKNMPFDQFTIEQLAGDLLPNATDHQKIASGFNRNTRFNEEGGVDPEEYVIRYNIDRTNTLGQVWLGMTLGCAECHSHKYDPISHKEYYQLFAYFTGITEPMIEGDAAHGKPLPPLLRLPAPEQTKALAEHRRMSKIIDGVIARELARFAYKDPLEGKPLPDDITDDLVGRSQIAWEARSKGDPKFAADVQLAFRTDPAKRTADQKKFLREYYLCRVNPEGRELVGPFDQDRTDTLRKIQEIEAAIPHCLVSQEMKTPRPAHVLIRGDFLHKGERVERGVPAIFPPPPVDVPTNRLGLARWLFHPDHPLTARVAVNRLWAQMFGTGLVRTVGDFGTQGEYPSHPELLDWLACEFAGEPSRGSNQVSAWDVKHLLRAIALSATYQQSSVVPSNALKIDPHNRLLAYAPRYRLSAEEIRDSALAISGALYRKIGGPSFMPYQPSDYYAFKNEKWQWMPSDGEEQYRRGLYAFWRRTALHPMFVAFDAPSREECVVVRPRTNTPLQALVTLNDPTFVEAARVFAQKVMTEGPKGWEARLVFAFRHATCRTPDDAEFAVLRQRFQQQRKRYLADRNAASRLINAGQYPRDARLDERELAAWTALCNLLLNLDEVLTRE